MMIKRLLKQFKVLKDSTYEFELYNVRENGFEHFAFIFSIAGLVIFPVFLLIIYGTSISESYIHLTLANIFLFPLYILICRSIKYLNDKLIYFFIIHLFAITIYAALDLFESSFHPYNLFCFSVLYAIIILLIQRWYSMLAYNTLVFCLIIYGLQNSGDTEMEKRVIFGLFILLMFYSTLVVYSRQKFIKVVEDNLGYLQRILSNIGSGYVLFDFSENMKKKYRIVDFNKKALEELNIEQSITHEILGKKLFSFLSEDDIKIIRNLKRDREFKKEIHYHRLNAIQYAELSITLLTLKRGTYWLCIIQDVTSKVEKLKELKISEKRYRKLYYRNKAGVFTVDKESRIVNGNEAFFDMLDNTFQLGEYLFDTEQQEEWKFILDTIGEKETIQNHQTQFLLSNGSQKALIFSWCFDSQTNYIEGSVIDLTNVQRTSQALKQSEAKYRLIFEGSNDAILLLDGDKVLDVNKRAVQLFGKATDEFMQMTLFDLSMEKGDENKKKYAHYFAQLSNLRSINFEWDFNGNGKKVEADVTLVEVILEEKVFYQCVIHDRTEQNQNIRKIKRNQRNLENILENNPEGILIVLEKEVLYRNSEIKNMIDSESTFYNMFKGNDQHRFNDLYDIHCTSKTEQNVQLKLNGKSGNIIQVNVTMVSTIYEDQEATLIIIKDISIQTKLAKEKLRAEFAEETNKKLAQEITERIKAERRLQEQFLRTRAILDSSSNTLLLTLSLDHRITSFNTHFKNYFEQFLDFKIEKGGNFGVLFRVIVSRFYLHLFEQFFREAKRGKSQQFEIALVNENKWMEVFMNPIYDTKGQVDEISLVSHDITQKKLTEIEIIESLKEKKILLKEIHHRVKNNLQVISSILNLQSSFIHDENTLEILQESRNRIRSMAIIHENLYRTEDFSSINFAGYLKNLTANLINSYRIHDEVLLNTDLEDTTLILDQAIPCGLLVNELITNSLKYAWKPGERGTIYIELKEVNERISLIVEDDGIGLPMSFKEMNSDTLGLQLIMTLIEQLDGDLKVDCSNGTKYLIKFDKTKPNYHAES